MADSNEIWIVPCRRPLRSASWLITSITVKWQQFVKACITIRTAEVRIRSSQFFVLSLTLVSVQCAMCIHRRPARTSSVRCRQASFDWAWCETMDKNVYSDRAGKKLWPSATLAKSVQGKLPPICFPSPFRLIKSWLYWYLSFHVFNRSVLLISTSVLLKLPFLWCRFSRSQTLFY